MSNQHVVRLAKLALEWQEKHQRCVDIQEQITQLNAGGVVVVKGEEEFMLRLSARLDEAQSLFHQIKQVSFDDDATDNQADREAKSTLERWLTQLEETLLAKEWRLLEEIEKDVQEKITLEQQIHHEYWQTLKAWPINHLSIHLKDALRVKAPVRLEKMKIDHWREQITQAERYLKEQQYELLQERLKQLADDFQEAQEMLKILPEKEKTAGRLFQKAELLVIQTPAESKKQYSYAVLFRTPNEARMLGINLHNSRRVQPSDRTDFIKTLGKISRTVRGRLSGTVRHNELITDPTSTRGSFVPVVEREREPPPQLADELRYMGQLIYRLFIPEQIRRYLSQHHTSLTITTNDLELPWELMSDQDDSGQDQTLCLHLPVGRMPIGRALPNMKPQRPARDKIANFLLIYADPDGDLPEAEREIDLIREGLEAKWGDEINIDVLKREEVTGTRLNKIMLEGKYDVIHYAGHAYFNKEDPSLSGLLLHDHDVFFAQKIFDLLEGRPLVFLNACESGVTANEEPRTALSEWENPVNGLASAFIYGGALGCIGSLWPVYDRSAAEFAIHFYNLVLEGHMIGEAVRQSRCKIRDKDPNDITWAAFILYGDPTFVLV